jgi:RNA polymerase sigma-70 factor, ECF subfamily
MSASSLASSFLQGLGRDAPADADPGALEEALGEAVRRARAEHPAVVTGDAELARYLGERCRGAADPAATLSTLSVADLYLACGALGGDRAALAALDKVLAKVARATSRITGQVDEVHQRLRERVLVAAPGETPKLGDYAGAGSLEGWCRVAAARIALRLKEVPDRETTLEVGMLEEASPLGSGLETGVGKQEHAEALAQAFADATRALTHEERILLRYHFLDGLNFEEIAPMFRTHRSTISRRVASARKKLLDETKRSLRDRVGASTSELSSLIRQAQSQLDVDLTSWLRTQS